MPTGTITNFLNNFKVVTEVTEDKTTLMKVRAKTIEYFKMISIPGIPQIMATDSLLFKLIWTMMIVAIFAG